MWFTFLRLAAPPNIDPIPPTSAPIPAPITFPNPGNTEPIANPVPAPFTVLPIVSPTFCALAYLPSCAGFIPPIL